MVLKRILGAVWSRRLSFVFAAVQIARTFYRGNRRLGLLLLGVLLLAYRWSPLVIVLELLLRRYVKQRGK